MKPSLLFFVAFWGCGSSVLGVNKPTDDTGRSSGSGGNSNGGNSGGGSSSAVKPTITFGQAVCETTTVDQWFFNVAADDPQGLETVEPGGLLQVLNGENQIKQLGVTCNTSTGFCTGEYVSDVVTVSCAQASQHDFRFIVFDEDGNESDPYVVTGAAS